MDQSGNTRRTNETGVAAQRRKPDTNLLDQSGEGTLPNLLADAIQKPTTDRLDVSAERHGSS